MTSPWRQRGGTLLVTAVLLGATLAAWPGGAQAASGSVTPGTRLWVSRYNGINAGGKATAIAPTLGGATVIVTGLSWTSPVTQSWVTIAYNAKSGRRRWLTALAEGNGTGTAPRAIAVSTDGTKVFVTGAAPGTPHGFMTVAYDAKTGAQLWISTSSTPASPTAMVAFDSTFVYVTGSTATADGVKPDYLTIAYDAATGAQLWVGRYDGKAHGTDRAAAVAWARHGQTVLVTGRSEGTTSGADAATVAYDAATGAQEWVSRYNGPANRGDFGKAIAVNPGGRVAYVTGGSQGKGTGRDMVTISYSVATGARRWTRRYNAGGKSNDQGISIAIFRTGGALIVTGRSATGAGRRSDVTIGYNARAGKRVWVRHFKALKSFSFNPIAMVLGPLAAIGYVAGDTRLPSHKEGYGAVAFTLDGSVVWRSHYAGPAGGNSFLLGLAIGPQTGGKLYETGASDSRHGVPDFATVAYAAKPRTF